MVLEELRRKFRRLIDEEGLIAETVTIKAFPLTPEEAIGNPCLLYTSDAADE